MTAAQVARPQWLECADDALRADVHRLVTAVMELGGAVGWLGVPTRAGTDEWLTGVLDSVAARQSRVVAVRDDDGAGRLQALGRWTRYDKATVAVNAEILQVMVHPEARGRRLARVVMRALVEDAREHGVETLTLDVRGNNHAAMALYERLGFTVYGRLPDFVAVGDERWDRVLYRLDLRTGASRVRRRGGRPVGPGSSRVRADTDRQITRGPLADAGEPA